MYIYAEGIEQQLITMLTGSALLIPGEGNTWILMRHELKDSTFLTREIQTTQDVKN
jgi:hypothetical protein